MRFILYATAFCIWLPAFAQLPNVPYGKIERLESFQSKYVTPRHVDVWLPEGYTPQKKYAVLYMHDGQMLFDSTTTSNKQSWKVSEVMHQLRSNEAVRDVLVVGVWSGGAT
ncbi:MAG: alpha/beta hydrolase-fold protein, partial [Flammeovirgaceae bacterium]